MSLRENTPEQEADYQEAAELWNAMSQRERQELLRLVLELGRAVARDERERLGEMP